MKTVAQTENHWNTFPKVSFICVRYTPADKPHPEFSNSKFGKRNDSGKKSQKINMESQKDAVPIQSLIHWTQTWVSSLTWIDSSQIFLFFFSYFDVIALFIMHEVDCIKTPGHVILRNPLIRVLTPLHWHLNNLCCSAKITLEPLKVIVVLGWPGPHVTSPTNSVESRQVRAMVTIPRGCCCYLMVLDTTWLHSHWSVAKNP